MREKIRAVSSCHLAHPIGLLVLVLCYYAALLNVSVPSQLTSFREYVHITGMWNCL